MRTLYVAVFGLAGVFARYLLGITAAARWPSAWPWGTFAINLSGSFLIGVVWVLAKEQSIISEDLRVGLMVGLLGGYTTFSAYTLETGRLLEDGQSLRALLYFMLSPVLGLGCAMAGLQLTRLLLRS
jgi:CrcB protein